MNRKLIELLEKYPNARIISCFEEDDIEDIYEMSAKEFFKCELQYLTIEDNRYMNKEDLKKWIRNSYAVINKEIFADLTHNEFDEVCKNMIDNEYQFEEYIVLF